MAARGKGETPMGKNEIQWETVSFGERNAPACEMTFRPSGQIVFGAETLERLGYPSYVHLLVSPVHGLVALKAADSEDGDAIRLSAAPLPEGKPRAIAGRKIYRWLCNLIGQEEGCVLIRLMGETDAGGIVVFDLNDARVVPKRTHRTRGRA